MSIITDLHQAITDTLMAEIPGIETSGFYPKLREAVKVPAIFVDMASLEPGDDPGTDEIAYIARFEARIIVGAVDDQANAPLRVRELAAEVGRIIHKNSFGLPVKPAALVSIGNDGFSPDLDAYDVWMVEWEQEFHIGESVWDDDGIVPSEIYVGFAPYIGAAHEDKYIRADHAPETGAETGL